MGTVGTAAGVVGAGDAYYAALSPLLFFFLSFLLQFSIYSHKILYIQVFQCRETTGTQGTAGFVQHHVIFGLGTGSNCHRYGMSWYRYGMRNPDLRVTHVQP